MEEEFKTFKNLKEEVINRNLCGKCGGCYSFCSSEELHALEMEEDRVPKYSDEERALKRMRAEQRLREGTGAKDVGSRE